MVLMMNMIAATATTTTMMIMTMTWLRAVSLGQVGRRSRRADGFTSPRATKELFPTCGNVPCLAVLITIVIILLMSSLPSNVAIKLWSSLFFSWARPSISFVLYVLLGNCDETEISEPMMTRMKRKRRRRMATMKMTMVVAMWQKAALRPINISRTCQWLKTLTFAFASTQLENGEIWPNHWSWLSLMILVIHVLEREKSKPWHIIFISKVCPSYTISKPLCSLRIWRKA